MSLSEDWDIDFITNKENILKSRIVDIKTNQMLVRIDDNDKCARFGGLKELENYDVVVISDYNKGFLSESDIKHLIKKYPISFIDSKKTFGEKKVFYGIKIFIHHLGKQKYQTYQVQGIHF